MANDILYHYGVKGMKWGVRRSQKRISKKYKRLSDKVAATLAKNHNSMYVDAHNKAADYMNSGGINKFNTQQQKKYGKNYADRDGYMEDYRQRFQDELAKNWNRSLNDFYSNDRNVKKARSLVEKYDMTKWDDFAKQNEASVKEVREMVESYN